MCADQPWSLGPVELCACARNRSAGVEIDRHAQVITRPDTTNRVVAEQERCDFLVMTRETFTALPPWLARDLLTWKPGQVFVISQLPRTSLEKQLVFDELRRKAARARRLDAQEQTGQHAYG